MRDLVTFTVFGIALGAIYAVAASGLVVTYATSGIFNFAHGAVGAFGAFSYWQLLQWGIPTVPAIVLVLLVVGPAIGYVIERVFMRGLSGASEFTRIVVSIALLFGILRLIPLIWPPNRNYRITRFFGESKLTVGGISIAYHQLVIIGIAVAVAAGLALLLRGTRTGIAMRAVVDDRTLVQLTGGRPNRIAGFSWALGASLATLSGILVASVTSLEAVTLTFLVVNAFAAAVVGRLNNLPRTFVGALVLGLAQSYAQGYLRSNPSWVPANWDLVTNVRLAIPVLMLFVVLVALPHAPLRAHGLSRSKERVPRPTWTRSFTGAGLLIAGAGVLAVLAPAADRLTWSKGLAYALIMLSLVPLTGYGGQISLAPMTFGGIAAWGWATWGGGSGALWAAVAAVALAAVVGALVALPALRLQGIYLALATLAFAYFVERVVFTQRALFPSSNLDAARPSLFGLGLDDDRAYLVFVAVCFAVVGLGVVWLRLGPFGRRLQAMKDSPAACATLGIDLTRTKVAAFMLSAAIAGIGGILLAGVSRTTQVEEYAALQNLPIVLLAAAGGITAVSGSVVGGLSLAALSILPRFFPSVQLLGFDGQELLADLVILAPAIIGVTIGRDPNGIVMSAGKRLDTARRRREEKRSAPATPQSLSHSLELDFVGIDRDFTDDDIAIVDAALGLDAELLARPDHGAWEVSRAPA